jgi:hypothetical protein
VDLTGGERLFENLLLKPEGRREALGAVQPDFAYVRSLWYERAQQINLGMSLGHYLRVQS